MALRVADGQTEPDELVTNSFDLAEEAPVPTGTMRGPDRGEAPVLARKVILVGDF